MKITNKSRYRNRGWSIIFGDIIKKARIQKKLTLRELEELSKISKSQISNIERGATKVSKKNLEKLANALDIDKELLLSYWEPKSKNDNKDKEIHLRYKILKRDNFQCQLCGRSAPNTALMVSHIIPINHKGESIADNLLTLCKECNTGRLLSLKEDGLDNDFLIRTYKKKP